MADLHRITRLHPGDGSSHRSAIRRCFIRASLALLSVACLAGIGSATQAVLIEGYVFDSETGLPVGNVNVQPADHAAVASTDEKGRFVLHLSPGDYRLSLTHVGYEETRHELNISSGKHPVVYLELARLELKLDPIDVVAKRAETRFEELHEATRVLSGDELRKKYSITLAETMKNELGVAIQSMGPAPARPVIRGLSGDRVQINVDGIQSQDLSATSADHAVTVETFNAERLEIIRGPRTLLHTSTAGGGVINVVKHKIPETRPERFFGSVGAYGETANRGYFSSAALTAPAGPLALHAESTYRDTRDVQTPVGRLANTPINTHTVTFGMSYAGDRGYVGASFDQFVTQYGIPGGFIGAHPNGADLDIERRVFDGKAVYRSDSQTIDRVEAGFTKAYYHHLEFESSGRIGSEFLFHDYSGDLKLYLNTGNKEQNTVLTTGFAHRNLKLGAFVFTPPTRKQNVNLGLYHETTYRNIELQAAARYTYATFDPRLQANSNKILDVDRTFHTWSAAFSPLVPITDQMTAGFSLSRSQRAPTIEELYNEGPHLAAYTFEKGNVELNTERSFGAEAFIHYLQPGFDLVFTGFWNEFDDYIAPRNTGEINFAQLLPIYAAEGIDARMMGVETRLKWRPNARLELEMNLSHVRGENRDDRMPLPEMPPLKFVGSATYRHSWLTGGGTMEWATGQKRVDTYEDPTAGYSVFGVYIQRDILANRARHSIILSLENLFDTEYRNHLSRIRSVMPETGRSLKLNYKMYFF
ncbi:MAG: TonB-dependent receptor [Candidatus Latescibacteria bacterium]|nr:TonB-dependent receptor [Candidatus Latescibacterota bacterium]